MKPHTGIRILIADDHALVREGVRHVLVDEAEFEVVAEVADGAAALDAIDEHHPHVALVDLSMPDMSGIEVVARARERSPDTGVIILSMHGDKESVSRAIEAGAAGYLLKDEAGPAELRQAVRAVARGERCFGPGIAAALAEALRPGSAAGIAPLDSLTERETQVLRGIAEGLSNKQLAARLDIGRRTVESHRESLMRKLDIRSIAGLTRFAIEQGVIQIGPEPPPP